MFKLRKLQPAATLIAAVLCFAAARHLAAQDTGTRYVVYHISNGVFAAPPISGNDLLELEGNPFKVSVIAAKDSKPVKHGKGWAIYRNIKMQGAFTSTMDPQKPFPIHSRKGVLVLAVGDPNYDELKYTAKVTVTGIKLTIVADIQAPKGTLAGFEIKPLNNSVTLTNTPAPNVTVTYKDSTAATVLGVSTGTLTGTVGEGSGGAD